jgi:hypothetical protein
MPKPADRTARTSNPTQVVATSLPVVACPTTHGITPAPAPRSLPSTLGVSVPEDLASRLSVYADEDGVMDVVSPAGWDCSASFGADGSGGLAIFPAGEVSPSSSLPPGSTAEAIVASQNGGCQGCAAYQACPFFAAAVPNSPTQCKETPPAGESVTKLAPNVVGFEDPPGLAGDADPSGGAYPANSVMTYTNGAAGSSGDQWSSWFETCMLSSSQRALCTAVLSDFVSRYRNR